MKHTKESNRMDTAESRLRETKWLLEATDFEWFTLWERWCKESSTCREPLFAKCEQLNGWLVTCGYGPDCRPINISMQWNKLDGMLVCCWEPVSQLVDHLVIEGWLTHHYSMTFNGRNATSDAQNFHLCAEALKEWQKGRTEKWSDRPYDL